MVPEETQESTDSLPKPQTKSSITQPDVPEMVASDENVPTSIPEISQPCVNLGEAASTELLPMNVDEIFIRTGNDANAILDLVMLEELTFPFLDPSSALDIQVSTDSNQGAQGPCFSSSSSSSSSEPPNISYGGPTDTYLPNNLTGQNPQQPFFTNPYDYELEKLRREKESLKKNFEETTLELVAELERKMAETSSEYDKKLKEMEAEYKAKAMEEEAKKSLVEKNILLASAYMYKTVDTSDLAALRAKISSMQQQHQAVQTYTHMVNPTPLPTPSVTEAETPILSPLSYFPRCTTTQVSQQGGGGGGGVQSNTHMMNHQNTPPGLSVTAAEASSIPNLSSHLSHFPRGNRTQRRPIISQQAAVHRSTHVTSVTPPPPSVTAAEASILGPLSQQRSTHMTPTALPRPSVTAAGDLSLHRPRRSDMTLPRPPPVISNLTPTASTTTAASSPHVVRATPPHMQPFRAFRAPNSAATATTTATTYPTRLVQEHQQQVRNSNGGLVYLSDDEE